MTQDAQLTQIHFLGAGMRKVGAFALALMSLTAVPPSIAAPASGPAATLTASPAVVETATFLKAVAVVTDDDADSWIITVRWGDGTWSRNGGYASCASLTARPKRPLHLRQVFRHAYRMPGIYAVSAEVRTETCSPSPAETTVAVAPVTVLPGKILSNGPELPVVALSRYIPKSPRPGRSYVSTNVYDTDGFPTRLSLNWGDGTASEVVTQSLSGCLDPVIHWPAGALNITTSHQYRRPGRYRTTAVATTVGCDGKDKQQVIRQYDVVVR